MCKDTIETCVVMLLSSHVINQVYQARIFKFTWKPTVPTTRSSNRTIQLQNWEKKRWESSWKLESLAQMCRRLVVMIITHHLCICRMRSPLSAGEENLPRVGEHTASCWPFITVWALGKVPPSPETSSAGTRILEYSVKGNWLTEKMTVVWIPDRTA